jgi:hypothetical protein
VIAIAAWFIIVDFPDKAAKKGLLTNADAKFIEQRITDDRNDAIYDPLTWAKFFHHLKDWKLWCFAVMFVSWSSLETYPIPLDLSFESTKSRLQLIL